MGVNREKSRNIGLTRTDRFVALEDLQDIQHFLSINPVSLHYCGKEQCDRGYAFGPFVRTSYVIHMIISGKGRLMKEGNTFDISAGQAFIIYPGEETVYQADLEDPWCYMWIGFHGLLADNILSRTGFSRADPVITCHNMDRISEAMNLLLSCGNTEFADELMRTGLLQQILGLLIANNKGTGQTENQNKADEGAYVRTAVTLLVNGADPQVKVSEVAKTIGVSRGYLTRIFRKEIGISPQEFQLNCRMERAGDMLRSTDNPVSFVAEKLGYADVLSFSKCFRRYFGMSPTEFREQKDIVIRGKEKWSYTSDHPL